MPRSASLHLPSQRFFLISGRRDAQNNSVLYGTPAGNAGKLWMPDVDQNMDTRYFLLSILFDARVGRGYLDGAQAE
jgi:hypothetical protein